MAFVIDVVVVVRVVVIVVVVAWKEYFSDGVFGWRDKVVLAPTSVRNPD